MNKIIAMGCFLFVITTTTAGAQEMSLGDLLDIRRYSLEDFNKLCISIGYTYRESSNKGAIKWDKNQSQNPLYQALLFVPADSSYENRICYGTTDVRTYQSFMAEYSKYGFESDGNYIDSVGAIQKYLKRRTSKKDWSVEMEVETQSFRGHPFYVFRLIDGMLYVYYLTHPQN